MDATPSFGVTKIHEVPSNPQLTLVLHKQYILNFPPLHQIQIKYTNLCWRMRNKIFEFSG